MFINKQSTRRPTRKRKNESITMMSKDDNPGVCKFSGDVTALALS